MEAATGVVNAGAPMTAGNAAAVRVLDCGTVPPLVSSLLLYDFSCVQYGLLHRLRLIPCVNGIAFSSSCKGLRGN